MGKVMEDVAIFPRVDNAEKEMEKYLQSLSFQHRYSKRRKPLVLGVQ
jgi:hypothetical protein